MPDAHATQPKHNATQSTQSVIQAISIMFIGVAILTVQHFFLRQIECHKYTHETGRRWRQGFYANRAFRFIIFSLDQCQ